MADSSRLRVRFVHSEPTKGFVINEMGYVDGYVQSNTKVPYAVVVKDNGLFVTALLCEIELVK